MRARQTAISTALILLVGAAGCTEYHESGEMVRHHLGYVKVITPAVHAPNAAVRVIEVETYGLWLGTAQNGDRTAEGSFGSGIGYSDLRREFVPLDCRIVARVPSKADIRAFIDLLRKSGVNEEGVCVIQDSSLSAVQ